MVFQASIRDYSVKRTIRPRYRDVATSVACTLDPKWQNDASNVGFNIFPGMVMTRTQGDLVRPLTTAGQQVYGLAGLFRAPGYGEGFNEVRDGSNSFAVWVGTPASEFEILMTPGGYSAYNSTSFVINNNGTSAGTHPVPAYTVADLGVKYKGVWSGTAAYDKNDVVVLPNGSYDPVNSPLYIATAAIAAPAAGAAANPSPYGYPGSWAPFEQWKDASAAAPNQAPISVVDTTVNWTDLSADGSYVPLYCTLTGHPAGPAKLTPSTGLATVGKQPVAWLIGVNNTSIVVQLVNNDTPNVAGA
jgi:hypothetical protein